MVLGAMGRQAHRQVWTLRILVHFEQYEKRQKRGRDDPMRVGRN